MCRPVEPEVFGKLAEPELVHHVLHDERDLPHVPPGIPLARVEVDQEVVGPVDVVHARVPRVQVDAPEVDDPGERGRLVADREVRRPPGRELDVHGLEPVRVIGRDALLVEEPLLGAVGVALHLHRPPLDVVQHVGGDVEVVLDEVDLLQLPLREEDLVRVRDVDLAPPDLQLHRPILRFPDASLRARMRAEQCCAARAARRSVRSAARGGGRSPAPLREAEREGFEPSTHLSAGTRFPVAFLRPLGHLSGRG